MYRVTFAAPAAIFQISCNQGYTLAALDLVNYSVQVTTTEYVYKLREYEDVTERITETTKEVTKFIKDDKT